PLAQCGGGLSSENESNAADAAVTPDDLGDAAPAHEAAGEAAATADTSPGGEPVAKVDGGRAAPDGLSGGTRCDGTKALFCEDFESGMLDRAKWTTDTVEGSVKVDTGKAAPGSHFALAVHMNNMPPDQMHSSHAAIKTTQTFPLAGKTLFIR